MHINSFYADCENNLFEGELYFGNGAPEIECQCCTDCCSPGPQGECRKRDTTNTFDLIQDPSSLPSSDSVLIAETIQKTILDFITNDTHPEFEDEESAYSKALTWLSYNDQYTQEGTEYFIELFYSTDMPSSRDMLYNIYADDISMRYLFVLLYYEMSGDEWLDCSGPDASMSLTMDESSNCSYINRDLEVIDNKKRWLSPSSHVCTWAGLTCDDENNVVHIELSKYLLLYSISFCSTVQGTRSNQNLTFCC